MKQYHPRDPSTIQPFYDTHVDAIEKEGLTNANDIAAELAFRDAMIADLKTARHEMKMEANPIGIKWI